MRIAFTGHRPNKLGGYDWNTPRNQKIMMELEHTIITLLEDEDVTDVDFICGGALGIDQMAFEICNTLKETTPTFTTIEVAIPFKDQPNAWFKKEDKDRYSKQLSLADKITYVDEVDGYIRTTTPKGRYNAYKMQVRNEYMIDNADVVIAVWDGTKGGTGNCVGYAKKKGKRIIQLNPKDI